jgi:hypothetical protein
MVGEFYDTIRFFPKHLGYAGETLSDLEKEGADRYEARWEKKLDMRALAGRGDWRGFYDPDTYDAYDPDAGDPYGFDTEDYARSIQADSYSR